MLVALLHYTRLDSKEYVAGRRKHSIEAAPTSIALYRFERQ
jgi:hypothetical protein